MFGIKYIFAGLIIGLVLIGCSSKPDNESGNRDNGSTMADVIDPISLGIDPTYRIPEGLPVNSKAPGFAGRDIWGQSFDLYSELKEGPVLLMFYRGKWCGVCNEYMSNFNDSIGYLQQKGLHVVAVTPELPKNANEFASNTNSKFSIISDPTLTIMNVFDVTFKVTEEYANGISTSKGVEIAENNGKDEAYLPIPATYLIGSDGSINYVHFSLNFRDRASVKEILAQLK